MTEGLKLPDLEEVRRARDRIVGFAVKTPLFRLRVEDSPAEIFLKLENLQPIGSFKLRGAGNAIRSAPRESLERGVFTASAGNMAQGVGFCAQELGVKSSVVVPDHAPETKLAAIERLGMELVKVPFDDWWEILLRRRDPGLSGVFVHPVADPRVMAGNGTIGLEILEDLPDVDAVVIPFGGGGLLSGIGSVFRHLRPETRIYACEVETAAPLKRSLLEGRPSEVEYRASFVDGIGGRSVLPEMWPLVRSLVEDSLVVSLAEVAAALRLLLERNRVLAEGAGAAPVAAALAGRAGGGKVVCVVSGGNLDRSKLIKILGEGS